MQYNILKVWPLFLALTCCSVSSPAENPQVVSLVQLIATPERFDGKLVTVIGFFQLDEEGEGDSLYLHHEDSRHALTRNRVIVARNSAVTYQKLQLNGNYVLVTGRFRAARPKDDSVGKVIDITRCMVWSNSDDPRGGK